MCIRDSFLRVLIAGPLQPTYMNENGIYIVNIFDFLRNPMQYIGE